MIVEYSFAKGIGWFGVAGTGDWGADLEMNVAAATDASKSDCGAASIGGVGVGFDGDLGDGGICDG